MGNTLRRVLATAPLAVALAVVGVTGTAHATTSTAVGATKLAAEPSGVCTIYVSGTPIRTFVSTERVCLFNAVALMLTFGDAVTFTWFPVAVG